MLAGLAHSWHTVGKQCKERKEEELLSREERAELVVVLVVEIVAKQQVTQGNWKKRPRQQSRGLSCIFFPQ